MALKDELAQVQAQIRKALPAPVLAELERAAGELVAADVARGSLRAGETAPDFALPNQRGEVVRLGERLRRGPVVVTFFRGP